MFRRATNSAHQRHLPSSTADEPTSLAEYRGRSALLVSYPPDWSPVGAIQSVLPLFDGSDAQVLASSVDGICCHTAFAKDQNLRFPLLSDFEPKAMVAKAYGVYDYQKGQSQRALFVIDSRGLTHWSYVSPPGVNPGADGILRALESIEP